MRDYEISHRLGDGTARSQVAHEQSELLFSEDRSISRSENSHPGVRCQQPRSDYSDIGSYYTVVQNRSQSEATKGIAISSGNNQRASGYIFFTDKLTFY